MLHESPAYSGFSVNDPDQAKRFYGDVLGLTVTDIEPDYGLFSIGVHEGRDIFVYTKQDHTPASFTILNFPVPDIEAAVDALVAKGIEFTRYDDFPHDERGIMRGKSMGMGPDIAWFTDPAGNVLSVHDA